MIGTAGRPSPPVLRVTLRFQLDEERQRWVFGQYRLIVGAVLRHVRPVSDAA